MSFNNVSIPETYYQIKNIETPYQRETVNMIKYLIEHKEDNIVYNEDPSHIWKRMIIYLFFALWISAAFLGYIRMPLHQ